MMPVISLSFLSSLRLENWKADGGWLRGLGRKGTQSAGVQLFSLSLSTVKAAGFLPAGKRGRQQTRGELESRAWKARSSASRGGSRKQAQLTLLVPKSPKSQCFWIWSLMWGGLVGLFQKLRAADQSLPGWPGACTMVTYQEAGCWGHSRGSLAAEVPGSGEGGPPRLQRGDAGAKCGRPCCLPILAPRTPVARPSHSRQEISRFPEEQTR